MTAPVDQAVTTSGVLQNPVVVVVLALLVIVGLAGDVAGKWVGPVTALKARREKANPPAAPALSPEVQALQSAVAALEAARRRDRAEIVRLVERIGQQDRDIDVLRGDQAASNRVLAAHTRWDRAAQQALASAGIAIDPPPPVYVTEENPT